MRVTGSLLTPTIPYLQGVYQCIAVNKVGQVSALSHITAKLPYPSPPAPHNLKGEALSPVSIRVSWDPVARPYHGEGSNNDVIVDQLGFIIYHIKEGTGQVMVVHLCILCKY